MIFKRLENQQGSALMLSLVFLLLTSLVAVSAARSSASQEQMAANLKHRNDSFQAAESGLRLAERWLSSNHVDFAPCSGRACHPESHIFEVDTANHPGPGWMVLAPTADTNHMTVWYQVINLGTSSAAMSLGGDEEGTLFRILVVAFRGTTRTVLEGVYVHLSV